MLPPRPLHRSADRPGAFVPATVADQPRTRRVAWSRRCAGYQGLRPQGRSHSLSRGAKRPLPSDAPRDGAATGQGPRPCPPMRFEDAPRPARQAKDRSLIQYHREAAHRAARRIRRAKARARFSQCIARSPLHADTRSAQISHYLPKPRPPTSLQGPPKPPSADRTTDLSFDAPAQHHRMLWHRLSVENT